jgi:hypothetical protein
MLLEQQTRKAMRKNKNLERSARFNRAENRSRASGGQGNDFPAPSLLVRDRDGLAGSEIDCLRRNAAAPQAIKSPERHKLGHLAHNKKMGVKGSQTPSRRRQKTGRR